MSVVTEMWISLTLFEAGVFGMASLFFLELSSLVLLQMPSSSRIMSGRPVEMSHCGAERGANYVSNPGDLDRRDILM